jgi:hypothetical protein
MRSGGSSQRWATTSTVPIRSLSTKRCWYRAVGFHVRNYPDNPVVRHAYRLAGGNQDTFIGGSPLLVDVATTRSFFPAIYNQDWLFLFDSLNVRVVAAAGVAAQLAYDPYETAPFSPARSSRPRHHSALRRRRQGPVLPLRPSASSVWSRPPRTSSPAGRERTKDAMPCTSEHHPTG